MTKLLADLLKAAGQDEVTPLCYLLLGELLPAYRGVEFNIAERMMIQVLASAYQREAKEIEKRYKAAGDLGDIAYELAGGRKTAKGAMSVGAAYLYLLEIARESGQGSQERKITKMAILLSNLEARSAKYVTRIPVGKLRLGFSEATLLDALSLMETGDKSARPAIEQAYNVTADIGEIAGLVKASGLAGLARVKPKPGVPIRPALAERLPKIEELFEKAGAEVGVEQKFDGLRTQIHIWEEGGKKRISLFSRNLENTTPMFPEISEAAQKLKVKSAILDGETIGYDPRTGKFAAFQETVQRKRKYEIEKFVKKIPLSVFVFDILYLDGKSLLELAFGKRREILEGVLKNAGMKGAIRLASQRITDDPVVIQEELKKSLDAGLEGLVVKNLKVPYRAGSRGFHWIKLKAASAMLEKLRAGEKGGKVKMLDTVDCVVMGAYKGRGKRAEFGIGGLLLGVRGKDERYYTISRLGTGFSDEQFRETKRSMAKLKAAKKPKDYVVDEEIEPDIWARPALVAEILADEITLSPRHTAGRKPSGRGYSLRFPRLVRYRDDKNPDDATTVKEIEAMYKKQ